MKLALVHESLAESWGAERVLTELRAIFPGAPVFVLESGGTPEEQKNLKVSFIRRLPRWVRRRRWHTPLLPIAPETFDLSAYDVVLSTSSSFAKGIVTRPLTLHLCYCHTPTRFLWDGYAGVRSAFAPWGISRAVFTVLMHVFRLWDRAAARRVDAFFANSETTRMRLQKYYRRDAVVIPPPNRFSSWPIKSVEIQRQYFLFVGRLSPYKNARLTIEAFNKLELPLVVAGEGRERRNLESLAGPSITFKGRVSDHTLAELYAGARAVIFPSDDDFGLVPVEAMSFGTPVIALRRGGATETVVEGLTGEFFDEPLEEFLAEAVRRFLDRERSYDRVKIKAQSAPFSTERFRAAVKRHVSETHLKWCRAQFLFTGTSGKIRSTFVWPRSSIAYSESHPSS